MQRGIRRLLRFFVLILILLVTVLVVFRIRYSAKIRSLAETHVINSTSDLINDAIDKQIATGNIQYDRIIYFEKDLDG